MTRPPIPPLRPLPPRPGLFRATPPAIFTPAFGLLGLGLAWRRGAAAFALPDGPPELLLGAATLLYLFCVAAYLAKVARRPGVVPEDLRVLPGRAGLTAGSLSLFLLALTAVPYSAALAAGLLYLGLLTHAALAVGFLRTLRAAPPEGRQPTPIWHLAFVGFIIAALPAAALGMGGLARGILFATIPVAAAIWMLSARHIARNPVPAPLRPLLAIHLAPAALFATVATMGGLPAMASGFAVVALIGLAVLALLARWLTVAGFSPLWGAFAFPLAAAASALLAQPQAAFRMVGAPVLAVATLATLPIAARVFRLWMRGQLAARTNAATA